MQNAEAGAGHRYRRKTVLPSWKSPSRRGGQCCGYQQLDCGAGGPTAGPAGAQSWAWVSLGGQGRCPGWAGPAQEIGYEGGFPGRGNTVSPSGVGKNT